MDLLGRFALNDIKIGGSLHIPNERLGNSCNSELFRILWKTKNMRPFAFTQPCQINITTIFPEGYDLYSGHLDWDTNPHSL